MRLVLNAIATALLCAGMIVPVNGQTIPNHNQPAVSSQIVHGEYLVKNVSKCGDCHTPMNDHGEPVSEKWLQGSAVGFKPLGPVPAWAPVAPGIAGLPKLTTKQSVDMLMTGVGPNGQPLRPPMPQFHMNRADAEAVTAYLKSLK
jgi:mono/diheme cytochrome c family protein